MASKDWSTRARAALRRYRVMALTTGVTLLVFTAEMIVKYVLGAGDDVMRWLAWIPFVHGWVYVVYLVTVVDVWSTMRWGVGRLALMVVGGTIPFLSFVVERRMHRAGEEQLAAGAPRPRGAEARAAAR